MRICSGLLIGQSTPLSSTHGARGHDSSSGGDDQLVCHNRANEGPQGKSTLTPGVASRCTGRQLWPGGGGQLHITQGHAREMTIPINRCRAGWDNSTIGGSTVLPTEARKSSLPWHPILLRGTRVKLRSRRDDSRLPSMLQGTWFPIGWCHL